MSTAIVGGLGYWGQNLVRCFKRLDPDVQVIDTQAGTSIDDIDIEPEGIVIATPPETHCDLAIKAAETFPHAKLLLEKPMVLSEGEIDLLDDYRDRIMVDHTFLYVPEFEFIKQILESGEMGDPLYAHSDRLNLGKFQPCGVAWDLAPHDLALFQWLFGAKPRVLGSSAFSVRYTHPDIARIDLAYGDVRAHLHMSWIHPTKVRQTTIVCTGGMVVYDMMAAEKIKIYMPTKKLGKGDVTGSYGEYLMGYRGGDILSPAIEQHEPLMAMCQEFINFYDGDRPRSDFSLGASVVEALCKAK